MALCPCCSEKKYVDCYGRFIEGKQPPGSAEELMRSRYTAYTQANVDYIERTMKSPALDRFDKENAREWAARVEWLKLEVVNSFQHNLRGFVEFAAHYKENNKRHVIVENSEFHQIDGHWFYVDGTTPKVNIPVPITQVGRNDPCLCGSGKKYKKCCGGITHQAR